MTNENYLDYMQKNYEYPSKNIEEIFKKSKRSAMSEWVCEWNPNNKESELVIVKILL